MTGPAARMTVTDIAELAGVERSTVSNWQRRYRDSATPFPAPLADSPAGRPQFDPDAVRAWLAQRYPEAVRETDRGIELVRTWRYTVSQTDTDEAADPLAILIAAATGETITFRDSGDPRYPLAISAAGPSVAIHATEAQAEAIRAFLDTETRAGDNTELLAAAIADYDNLNRWRRTKRADQAEDNLYALIGQIVHEESESVLDFACGTGALLSAVAKSLPTAEVVGMEPTSQGAFIADARFAHLTHSTIEHADILETDTLAGRTFDAVVSIPPIGRRVDPGNDLLRQLPFGPVRGTADAAWPQLAAEALGAEGEAFLVLPHHLTSGDKAAKIRRTLIQQRAVRAVITLPPNAHPASKTLTDLWILAPPHRPDKKARAKANRAGKQAVTALEDLKEHLELLTKDQLTELVSTIRDTMGRADAEMEKRKVLFVDFSAANPSEPGVYAELGDALDNWLDDPDPGPSTLPNDPRYAAVAHELILDSTVNLDPLYWTARAATPTSAPELIAAVNEATLTLIQARQQLMDDELPEWALCADRPDMTSVRRARFEGWLDLVDSAVRRLTKSPDRKPTSENVDEATDLPTLGIEDAEAMWRGDDAANIQGTANPTMVTPDTVQAGDVLVWANPERQIRATVSTLGGMRTCPEITVLRCDPDALDPHYLALTLATGRNAIQVTGKATPTVRAYDLSFPMIPPDQQRQFAHYTQAAQHMTAAAHHLADAATALRQALADAAGSGAVGITDNDRSSC